MIPGRFPVHVAWRPADAGGWRDRYAPPARSSLDSSIRPKVTPSCCSRKGRIAMSPNCRSSVGPAGPSAAHRPARAVHRAGTGQCRSVKSPSACGDHRTQTSAGRHTSAHVCGRSLPRCHGGNALSRSPRRTRHRGNGQLCRFGIPPRGSPAAVGSHGKRLGRCLHNRFCRAWRACGTERSVEP